MFWWLHDALQVEGLPVIESMVQGLPSLQLVGQVPGGSQVSPGSMMPLPQTAGQSLSLFRLQPLGQHPSPPEQAEMGVWVQCTLQVLGLPVIVSVVHGLLSLQLVGQVPGGSQVSPASTAPLPHTGLQLLSELALQPLGQQPSLLVQVVIGVWVHCTLQVPELPVMVSTVHGLLSLQLVGQVPGGSHVSPGSTTPLPHTGVQLLSVLALQPPGQQPSLLVQVVMGV